MDGRRRKATVDPDELVASFVEVIERCAAIDHTPQGPVRLLSFHVGMN